MTYELKRDSRVRVIKYGRQISWEESGSITLDNIPAAEFEKVKQIINLIQNAKTQNDLGETDGVVGFDGGEYYVQVGNKTDIVPDHRYLEHDRFPPDLAIIKKIWESPSYGEDWAAGTPLVILKLRDIVLAHCDKASHGLNDVDKSYNEYLTNYLTSLIEPTDFRNMPGVSFEPE